MAEPSRSTALHPVEQIVARGHCMGCGICTLLESDHGVKVSMAFDARRDMFAPKVENWSPGQDPGRFTCPGATMNMPALSEQKFGRLPQDPILGNVVAARAGYAADRNVRDKAASGGVTSTILRHLFETGQIDAAYTLAPGKGPYEARGRLVRSVEELGQIHGSNYHPAGFGAALQDLVNGDERFAFVGLPCEVAGLEMLKRQKPDLAGRHVVSIGLFCGGINTYRGIAYYLEGFDVDWDKLAEIEYRHGPWPGRIRAVEHGNPEPKIIPRIRGNSRWMILRYVIAFQGYWMLQRCRMCPDQVSDFADIAVGDPHLPRFRAEGGKGFSVILTRTQRGEELVRAAVESGRLAEEPISLEETVTSQSYTLQNRRHNDAYRRMGKFWRMAYPDITLYPQLQGKANLQHLIYAWVDLMKIALPKNRVVRVFYYPWQIFEYLFLTFAPGMIVKRLVGLIRNR